MIRLIASSMLLARYKWFPLVLALLLLGSQGHAQTDELLPEIDVYYKVNRDVWLSFQTKETREGGTPTSAELGPSLDVYLTRLSKLVKITSFDPDDSKARPLILSIGYRYLPTPGQPPTNRVEPVLTAAFPIPKAGMLLTDPEIGRTWIGRMAILCGDTEIGCNCGKIGGRISSYHLSPYASAELFCMEGQYSKWSDTALYAGCIFPILQALLRTQSVLRTPEQYRQKPKSADKSAGADARSVFLKADLSAVTYARSHQQSQPRDPGSSS